MIRLDVVVPVYGNQDSLVELTRRLRACAVSQNWDLCLVFVNDASPDGSGEILDRLAAESDRIRVLHLPANLGQQGATFRGLELAEGDLTCVMDADLQDPPEALARLVEEILRGYEVVFAGRRGNYESSLRLFSSRIFKTLVALSTGIPRDAGAFLIMTRRARTAILRAKPHTVFLPGMVGALRLHHASIPVERQPRASGVSAYRGGDRLRLGIKYLTSLLLDKFKGQSR